MTTIYKIFVLLHITRKKKENKEEKSNSLLYCFTHLKKITTGFSIKHNDDKFFYQTDI